MNESYSEYGDFQCDTTGGFPTMLCVDWENQKYWLEPADIFLGNELGDSCFKAVEDTFKEFGVKRFYSVEDLISKLKNIGEEAYENCADQIADEFDIENY